MRRRVLILGIALAGLAFAPGALALPLGSVPLTPVRVKPRVGGAHTRFRFSLRVPSSTGPGRAGGVFDTLSVSGPRRTRCSSSGVAQLPAARAGTRVSVRLGPGRGGRRWCRGRFHGYVLEAIRSTCSPRPVEFCPQLVVAPRVIARFSFRVR